jgi:2-polyprenyl-3-methyl-5-hydroxy-6-metoxy-1,4-benzoquinol methylase
MAIEQEYRRGYDELFNTPTIDPSRQPVFRSVLQHLSAYATPPGQLLDIGCGAGEFALLCMGTGWACYGIELSRQAREAAARQGVQMLSDDLLQNPGTSLQHSKQFDVITLLNVLDHACDPIGLLRRVHQMLKPGGVVVIRVPNATFQLAIRGFLHLLRAQSQQAFHLYVFSPSTLEKTLNGVGLKTISVRNSKTGCTPSYALVNGDEPRIWQLIWRFGGLGLWSMAQCLYWLTNRQVVWAPSFELVATGEE